jgi:hypothetical protein
MAGIAPYRLVTQEQTHLYNQRIDGRTHRVTIERALDADFDPKFFDNEFDWSVREKCCNVISFMLYFIEPTDEIALKYLLSIERSLKIITKKLPGWVVRVYFGSSVVGYIDLIKEVLLQPGEMHVESKKRIITAYQYIYSHPQVEVYIFDDDERRTGIPIAHNRIIRFTPLIDPRVACFYSSEADGCFTHLNCHNLQQFYESPEHLFYLPEYIKVNQFEQNRSGNVELFSSYSTWLYVYKSIMYRYYFYNHKNVYDLLAGGFCTKLKPKAQFYIRSIEDLRLSLQKFDHIRGTYTLLVQQTPQIKFQDFIGKIETDLIPESITGKEREKIKREFRCGKGKLTRVRDDEEDFEYYTEPNAFTTIEIFRKDNPACISDALFTLKTFLHRLHDVSSSFDSEITEQLKIGFDEMLLLQLFRRFISINLEGIPISPRGVINPDRCTSKINRIKKLIIAPDDPAYQFIVELPLPQLKRITDGIVQGPDEFQEALTHLMTLLPPAIILPPQSLDAALVAFIKTSYDRFDYLYIYVLIDVILQFLDPTSPAINVWVHISGLPTEIDDIWFNVHKLLNFPVNPILEPLYELFQITPVVPVPRPPVSESFSVGGSKRHHNKNTSFIKKMTNRRCRMRLYRSRKKSQQRKKSYRKHNKQTYKYKK